jgi:hypothetical protein
MGLVIPNPTAEADFFYTFRVKPAMEGGPLPSPSSPDVGAFPALLR